MIEIPVHDPGTGNRLSIAECAALRSQLKAARRDGARAVLLRVAPDAWAQDVDPKASPHTARSVSSQFHALAVELFGLDLPVVVHLEGNVVGLGLTLALAGDIRFATSDTRFAVGDPESTNALSGGTAWILSERIGSALSGHLAWTGQSLTAADALRLHLISELVEDDTPARDLAKRLASLPTSVTSTLKRSTNARLRGEFGQQLDYDSWLAQAASKALTHG